LSDIILGHGRPLEFLLTGFKPDPWTMADTLVTVKLLSFASLAEVSVIMLDMITGSDLNNKQQKLMLC